MDDTLSLNHVTAADFTPLLGETFAIVFDDAPAIEVVLSDVSSAGDPAGGRAPFVLTFTGAPGVVLPQRIYRFTHPRQAAMEIFIAPIAADDIFTTYEAVFA